MNPIVLTTVFLGASSVAAAQSLLIPDSNRRVVMEFDATTGALIHSAAIDLAALTDGAARAPFEVLQVPSGELWVSDLVADTIFRVSSDGSTYLGTVPAPLDGCRGLCFSNQGVLVANSGTGGGAAGDALVDLDPGGNVVTSALVGDPCDVEPFTFNGVPGYLVSDIFREQIVFADAADLANQVVFHSTSGTMGIDTPEQIHVSATGRVFAAGSSTPLGIYEYSSTGDELNYINVSVLAGLSGVRGVHLLGNGNLLFTTGQGVHIYDTSTFAFSTVINGVSGRYISVYSGTLCYCANYCEANPNSSGLPGVISVAGSYLSANNDLTLTVSQLPRNSFGYFLTSLRRSFSANPSGSQGNLCLGGSIGRYVGPGQIQNAGASGSFSLAIDLTQTPQPLGFETVMAGETWSYQAWFRDSLSGTATSNFTSAIGRQFM